MIFFKANITSRAQLRRVVALLQDAAAQSPTKEPLLLMTDQEGGAIRRLAGAPLLSEKAIGRSPDGAALAAEAGRGAALNLEDVGLNVNLSPVVDVYRAPGDFVDEYGRSYSMDPSVVASLGTSFVVGQQRAGVAATAKHFPGLGAASLAQNTDERPVTLGVPLGTLRTVDERPYRSAIAAGVRLVMVSWATYPALDAARPAGLSPVIVRQELRGRLGFTGVTITDSLGAGALSGLGGTAERAVLAAGAGMDLLLCADKRASEGMSAVKALAAALASGRLDREAFAASSARVSALRSVLQQD